MTVLEINFFLQVASTIWYKKVVAKLTYPVPNIGGRVIAQLPSFVRFKALIIPLTIWTCVLSYQQKNNVSENGHFLPRNYFHNRIPR